MDINFEIVKDYKNRLSEVLKNTGKLTDVDLDYCLLLSLHEANIEITKVEQVIPGYENAIHDGHNHSWKSNKGSCSKCGCNYPY